MDRKRSQNCEKMKSKITKFHDISAYCMFNLVRISIFWSKSCLDKPPRQNHGSIKSIKERGSAEQKNLKIRILLITRLL